MEVCSARAWATDPARVLRFYNERRRGVARVDPNDAHYALADLARDPRFAVTIVTQNIDNLHEKAGSPRVLHLHGEIMKKRSDKTDADGALFDCAGDIEMGDLAPDGGQFRQHVVMFQESLPQTVFNQALDATEAADILVVVGTTLQVAPAAYVATETGARRVFVVDPDPPDPAHLAKPGREVTYLRTSATDGIAQVVSLLRAA